MTLEDFWEELGKENPDLTRLREAAERLAPMLERALRELHHYNMQSLSGPLARQRQEGFE